MMAIERRLPVGAEPLAGGGGHFRVWAPGRREVRVLLEEGGSQALCEEASGYFAGTMPQAHAGALYRYALDGGGPFPDPASRFQPQGPHGPSELVDPAAYVWGDAAWPGLAPTGQVLYELHVGTFTAQGGWAGARARLRELAELGVTALELMPVAEFSGRFGWGYDGVDLFAPTRLYGRPDELKRFVDEAHAAGLGVILDVVYNHLGPDGNYLKAFSPDYFSARYKTDWGEALNFDGPGSAAVREFVTSNAAYWISEYHCDGLRVDATQNIYDSSAEHVLAALCRGARLAAGGRSVLLIAENEPQDPRMLASPEMGGYGFDAMWNDDFHHTARVALTGRREAYYLDYRGSAQELISATRSGFLFQGQGYVWQGKRRGGPTAGLQARAFINYLDNHDQIPNSNVSAQRLSELSQPGAYRALTAVLLLGPGTPLLFQGQEYAARDPFHYFADHKPGLREAVFEGRRSFMRQMASAQDPAALSSICDPSDPGTFERSKVRRPPGAEAGQAWALHRDLLRLRRDQPLLAAQDAEALAGAALGDTAFALRFHGDTGTLLLVVNLGSDLALGAWPEPLLAPPPGCRWELLWSSEDPRYGGGGTPPACALEWGAPGRSAVLLEPRAEEAADG